MAVEDKEEDAGTLTAGLNGALPEAHIESSELAIPLLDGDDRRQCTARWPVVVVMLLSLQLGWGLWLMPADFARLGWIPATAVIVTLTVATIYSGLLLLRLYQHVPNAVLFGDIGEAAAGRMGRTLVYWTVYSLDATRCIILHLAATQSLQHASNTDDCLLCAGVVGIIALLLGQVKSLADMGWFLSMGTTAQLFALVVVVVKLILAPDAEASTELVHTGSTAGAAVSIVAVMNMIFAYGGQFAYVEIINSMERPGKFSTAVSLSTPIMSLAYLSLGVIGYWSKGSPVPEIIIFGTGMDVWSRVAAGAILFQALAQYLVNLNVWTHNVLTIIARRKAVMSSSSCNVRCAGDHARLPWLAASACIIAYSFGISWSLPFFSTLVGLVTSVTYLTCAYTIPCWFTLRLLGSRISRAEYALCWALVPLSIGFSCLGFGCSIYALVQNLGGGGEL